MEDRMSYPGIFIFHHESHQLHRWDLDGLMDADVRDDVFSSSITVILNSINDIMIDWWLPSLRMMEFWFLMIFINSFLWNSMFRENTLVRITRSWCCIRIFLLYLNDDGMIRGLEMSDIIKKRFPFLILEVLLSNFHKVLSKVFLDFDTSLVKFSLSHPPVFQNLRPKIWKLLGAHFQTLWRTHTRRATHQKTSLRT